MSYDQEFAEAMKLKLELNRQARKSRQSESSVQEMESVGPNCLDDFREQAISETLANHPGLTREKVIQGMEEMGF